MFQITDRAATQLKTVLSETQITEGACFRVGVVDNEVRFVLDQQRDGDTNIEHEGEIVLVLDHQSGELLRNHKLDIDKESSGLVLREAT